MASDRDPRIIRAGLREPFAPTQFPELNAVLRELTERAAAILGERFVGAYLQGSFAVGDADEHSDCDFIVVVDDALAGDAGAPDGISPAQEEALRAMHREFPARAEHWAQHLEGSYAPASELRTPAARGRPWLYIDHGMSEMERSTHCNTEVVRWSLRECGITLAGPPPSMLVDEVSADVLRANVRALLPTVIEDIESWISLDISWAQRYAVTTTCRMLHTIDSGRVTSKRAALLWARDALDARWRPLIQRALDGRTSFWRAPSDPADVAETRAFAAWAAGVDDGQWFLDSREQPPALENVTQRAPLKRVKRSEELMARVRDIVLNHDEGVVREYQMHESGALQIYARGRSLLHAICLLLDAKLPEEALILARELFVDSLRLTAFAHAGDERAELMLGWMAQGYTELENLARQGVELGTRDATHLDEVRTGVERQRRAMADYRQRNNIGSPRRLPDEKSLARSQDRLDEYMDYLFLHRMVHRADFAQVSRTQRLGSDGIALYLHNADAEYLIMTSAIAMTAALRTEKAALTLFGWTHVTQSELESVLDSIERDLAPPQVLATEQGSPNSST